MVLCLVKSREGSDGDSNGEIDKDVGVENVALC